MADTVTPTTATTAVAPVTTPAPPQPETPAAPPAKVGEEISRDEFLRLRNSRNKAMRDAVEAKRALEGKEKTWGEKLSKLSQLEKREAQAKLNPVAYLRELYGENWYESLSEAKLSGVAPANLVQAEMQKLRDEMAEKDVAREKAAATAAQQASQRQVESARRQLQAETASFYEASGKDYPLFAKYGSPATVAQVLAQRIEGEFHRTTTRDEAGNVVRPGRVLTSREAADLVEGELLGIAEAALGADKYRAKLGPLLQPKPAAGTVEASTQPQGTSNTSTARRKTLSNTITGSTQERKPQPTQAEKRERAIAAFEAARKRA